MKLTGKYFKVVITEEKYIVTEGDESGHLKCQAVDKNNNPYGNEEIIHKNEIGDDKAYRLVKES